MKSVAGLEAWLGRVARVARQVRADCLGDDSFSELPRARLDLATWANLALYEVDLVTTYARAHAAEAARFLIEAPKGVFQQQEYAIADHPYLWGHQVRAHLELKEFWAAGRLPPVTSVLVTACVSSGKSGTIAMAPLAVPGCRRVLVVCPNNDIADGECFACRRHTAHSTVANICYLLSQVCTKSSRT